MLATLCIVRREKDILELNVSSRISRRVGLNEVVTRFDVRRVGMDVDDLAAAELVERLEERLEVGMSKVIGFVVGKQNHADGTQILDSIPSLVDSFLSVRQRDDCVEPEPARVEAAISSDLLVQETRERNGQSLDRKSTRLNSSHSGESRMPSSA